LGSRQHYGSGHFKPDYAAIPDVVRGVIIGIVAADHPDWPAIKAFLEPAAKRGGVPILEEHELIWAIYDPDLIGAATARITVDGFGEVILVGGRDHRRWIHALDEAIGNEMRTAGMKSVRAYGRKGWVKVLKNWNVIHSPLGVGYEREL
jgi:hypothetical protein